MDFPVKDGMVQRAIDEANAAGGGRVVLEPGIYPCGTVYLKSNVELHLSAGARLQGSASPGDYDDVCVDELGDVAPEKSRKALLAAVNAENIAVTGPGEINGAGPEFYDRNVPEGAFFAKPPHPRPRMVQFYNCRGVRLEGTSFIDSPGWTMWLIRCENVWIHRIRVEGNQQMINNDGIDIDECRNVAISDSFFRTGDDCFILRAIPKPDGKEPVCENVTMTNCTLDSRCQGIRVGCPSDGTIRHCTFGDLVICGRGNGININNPKRYLRPGCTGYLNLHDVTFNNLVIESGNVPVWINVEDGIRLRRIGDMTFSNLRVKGARSIRLEGCEDTYIENVRFNEVTAEVKDTVAIVANYCRRLTLNQVELNNE